jgi:hypothetical protein
MMWVWIFALILIAWRLSQPELSRWLSERVSSRYHPQWSGAFTPSTPGLKLYQNPRDLTTMRRQVSASAAQLKQLELLSARVALLIDRPPQVSVDPRLCVAAQLVGELLARGHTATRAQELRALCEHVGLLYTLPEVTLVPFEPLTPIELTMGALEAPLLDALERARASESPRLALGLAPAQLEGGERVLLLLSQARACELQPFPRQLMGELGLSLSGTCSLRGAISLWLTSPRGEVKRFTVERGSGEFRGEFSITLPQLEQGAHRVELTLEQLDELGRAQQRSLMQATVSLNTPLPKEQALSAPALTPRFALMRRLKVREGLERARAPLKRPPLHLSRALSQLAEALLDEQDQAPHLNTARLPSALEARASRDLSLVCGAWGVDLDELVDQWLDSPHLRALITDQRTTHIGVSVRREANGRLAAVLILAAQPARLRLSTDRAEAYKLLQAHRRHHGVGRLPQNERLESLAQEVAEALARGQCRPHEALQHAQHLSAERLGQAMPLLVEASALEQIAQLQASEAWLELPLEVGVGLAQQQASAPIWVVVVMRVRKRSAIGDLSSIRETLDEAQRAEEERKRAHLNQSLTRRLNGPR